MARQVIALMAFGFLVAALTAQQPGTKAAPKMEIDVAFMNGSTVRMQILSEYLEIDTLYGKLKVPMKDVRNIEFGSHMPDGYAEKIEAAVKKLNHSDFKEREKAVAALVDLGPYSYAPAVEATRVPEAEASMRAKAAVQKLQAKFAKKDLKISQEDKVVTPSFTIAGRITTPVIKVKTEYFGDADLALATMRTLRSLGSSTADVDVTINAAKFAATGQWMPTSFQVDGRSTIVITAKGQIDLVPEQPGEMMAGPNGMGKGAAGGFGAGAIGKKGIAAKNAGGLLVGKIGENGDTFVIGARYEGIPPQTGVLYLHINPSPYSSSSSGSYEVKAARKAE